MPKNKALLEKFYSLTWKNLEQWAGTRIINRGRKYQSQGRVTDLAATEDGALIAWVKGSKKYAAKVTINSGGSLESTCSCPYQFDCKHGVATVIEYLKQVENHQPVPNAKPDDRRLNLLKYELPDDAPNDAEQATLNNTLPDIDDYLKGQTKSQLIELIHTLSFQFPEMARELSDQKILASGDAETLVLSLRKEIQEMDRESDWGDRWEDRWDTPDYSGIQKKLNALLKAGLAKEALAAGRDLIAIASRQVEESYDDVSIYMDFEGWISLIIKALDDSNLDPAEKLIWALDAVLTDEFEICRDFEKYLGKSHPKSAWHDVADHLLARLKTDKTKSKNDCKRDQISDWAIHALKQAGRKDEIIPLCMAETKQTLNYGRLVKELTAVGRYDDAKHWICEGIEKTEKNWPGMASRLRDHLIDIRTTQKDWPSLAATQVEEFIRHPAMSSFLDCKKAAEKIQAWPKLRGHLLRFIETGQPPWNKKGWPLPESGLKRPKVNPHNDFPLIDLRVEIAIFEKKPDQALKWYDQRPKDRFGPKDRFRWGRIDEDALATAVQTHAPDRATGIWKDKAEQLIAQVKPDAYQEAAKCLAKAAQVMTQEKKQEEWESYMRELRQKHARKRRLLEILDVLEDTPIMAKSRKRI